MLLVNLFLVCLAIGLDAADEHWVEQGDWVFDKKNYNSIEISGSRLTANLERRHDFQAFYRGIVVNETNKSYYWEFTCVKNCFQVGVVKDTHNSSGRTIKGDNGCFQVLNASNQTVITVYNASLFDSEYRELDFGDGISDGDRIGFILDAGEQELKIYIVQNDRPLGLAFIQKAPYSSELYPAVSFGRSPGIVEINEKKNVTTDHLLIRTDYLEKGIQGEYKLVKVNGTVPEMKDYFLRFGKPFWKNVIPVYVQLGNHTWPKRGEWSNIFKEDKDAEGDIYRFSTNDPWFKRAKRRASMETENMDTESMDNEGMDTKSINFESPEAKTFISAIENLKRVKFSDNFDELTIISTDPETTLQFKRFVGERPPYVTSELAA